MRRRDARATRGRKALALLAGVTTAAALLATGGPSPAAAQSLTLSSATVADLNQAFDAGTLS